jgi:hypothetical protein
VATDTLNYAPRKENLFHAIARVAWRFRRPLLITGITLSLYAGSYVGLSAFGRYEPIGGCLHGLDYAWAPAGFVDNFRWNRRILCFYTPMWYLDTRFWHTFNAARGGRYPIHTATVEEAFSAWHSNANP